MADDPTVLPGDALAERLIIFGLAIAIGGLTLLPADTIKLPFFELKITGAREYWTVLLTLSGCLAFTAGRFFLRVVETARSTTGDKDLRDHIVGLETALNQLNPRAIEERLDAVGVSITNRVDLVQRSIDGEGERIANALQNLWKIIEADAKTPEDHPIRQRIYSPANAVSSSVATLQMQMSEATGRLQQTLDEMDQQAQQLRRELGTISDTVRTSTRSARLFRFELGTRSVRMYIFDIGAPLGATAAAALALILEWLGFI